MSQEQPIKRRYGWRVKAGAYVPVPHEIDTIARIADLIESDGDMTAAELADTLNSEGRRPMRGAKFTPKATYNLLEDIKQRPIALRVREGSLDADQRERMSLRRRVDKSRQDYGVHSRPRYDAATGCRFYQ